MRRRNREGEESPRIKEEGKERSGEEELGQGRGDHRRKTREEQKRPGDLMGGGPKEQRQATNINERKGN